MNCFDGTSVVAHRDPDVARMEILLAKSEKLQRRLGDGIAQGASGFHLQLEEAVRGFMTERKTVACN